MPKYYCDYCDTYLTHDSPSVRKTHCQGRKHKENVRDYYQKWMEEQAQKLIDQTTAAFKSGKMPNTPFPMPAPRLMNPNMAPPRPGMPGMVPPPWAFALPPGIRHLGPPPNPAAMTALMTFRPPPGMMPPGVPPPSAMPIPSTE
ncbi:unnamed protein product [Adineta steineri]|uniref:U1 small nuclear ribonucleoprotein C n=1 Tax=Adineta steineri TaxID=433720 RepID=A0A818JN36_9BILA|nr:unnamed protein product [Adineta steineri]CAF1400116.1 unnamed protein product [Adineta steineri]CAF1446157.1 unnamed protein product [Adineta steineri]CAF1453850.1 unnamed protein product [Adineta steineri]CAF1631331.1 unnamed protein product [Adineta steineri]